MFVVDDLTLLVRIVAFAAAALAVAAIFLQARRLWRRHAVRRLLRDQDYHRLIEAQRRRSTR